MDLPTHVTAGLRVPSRHGVVGTAGVRGFVAVAVVAASVQGDTVGCGVEAGILAVAVVTGAALQRVAVGYAVEGGIVEFAVVVVVVALSVQEPAGMVVMGVHSVVSVAATTMGCSQRPHFVLGGC